MTALILASIAIAAWVFLLFGRGGFWRLSETDRSLAPPGSPRPEGVRVTAIVPARDEAEVVARSLGSLFAQKFSGALDVVLVDDQSSDGTAEIARAAAAAQGAESRLTVLRASGPEPGWTGKLAAMRHGFDHVRSRAEQPDFVLFCDADIAFEPPALERLVTGAQARGVVLASLMVKLRCESFAEKLFVPAFVFFFQMLYPFAFVNDPRRRTAAAAGGVMLLRPEALARAGGLAAIRGALIDDCALGALMKSQGPIWLGLTQIVHSLRAYARLSAIEAMVTRSAYAELHYSPLRLLGAIAGMAVVYLAPPLLVFAPPPAAGAALVACLLMIFAYTPTLRYYGLSPAFAFALPLIAACYTWFTLESALQHFRGRGGAWKGRFQAPRAGDGDERRTDDRTCDDLLGQDS
ncbi:MAG TPA: glycosyltransferase [Methylocystis sp.]|nr:glycosyltransferase [Methylocystis sp.]